MTQASFLEIYNEEIRDLLATEKNLKYDIKMADSKGADVYVTNLKVHKKKIRVYEVSGSADHGNLSGQFTLLYKGRKVPIDP